MNRNDNSPEIEARLHRSLSNQVRVPQLDRRFDAGVWARIEAEEQKQSAPFASAVVARKSGSERWLQWSNIAGIAVSCGLVLYFGVRMLGGADVGGSLSGISLAPSREMTEIIAWSVSVAAVGVAVTFTPLGRWLRAEFT